VCGNDSGFSFAKYDCSSADINPIGSVSKQDLRAFLRWAAIHLNYSSLSEVESAPPTAELEPIRANYNQVIAYPKTQSQTFR
jgi:NAD+ synthase (glutamine-hydrolysing)